MDLHHAACALQCVHRTKRMGFCRELIWRAQVADKYVKRLRKLHPEWGDGSLCAAAIRHQIAGLSQVRSSEFNECLSIFLNVLLEKRRVRSTPD